MPDENTNLRDAGQRLAQATSGFVDAVSSAHSGLRPEPFVRKNIVAIFSALIALSSLAFTGWTYHQTQLIAARQEANDNRKSAQVNLYTITQATIKPDDYDKDPRYKDAADNIIRILRANPTALNGHDQAILFMRLDAVQDFANEVALVSLMPEQDGTFTTTDLFNVGTLSFIHIDHLKYPDALGKIARILDTLAGSSTSTSLSSLQNAEIAIDQAELLKSDRHPTRDSLAAQADKCEKADQLLQKTSSAALDAESAKKLQDLQLRLKTIRDSLKKQPGVAHAVAATN